MCRDVCSSPAHVLGVGSITDAPVIDMKIFTELRGTKLLTTLTSLTLTRVKVLQDSAETHTHTHIKRISHTTSTNKEATDPNLM